MKFIHVESSFWHHPKTKRLIRDLGLEGVRSLQILWGWTAENRPHGNLEDLDCDDIEAAADWNGPKGEFFMAAKDYWFGNTQEYLGAFGLFNWRLYNAHLLDEDQ